MRQAEQHESYLETFASDDLQDLLWEIWLSVRDTDSPLQRRLAPFCNPPLCCLKEGCVMGAFAAGEDFCEAHQEHLCTMK